MQFYELTGLIANENWSEENDNRRVLSERIRKIARSTRFFNTHLESNVFFFVADACDDTALIGIICSELADVESLSELYLKAIDLELKDISLEESTFGDIRNMLSTASRCDFIKDDDEVLEGLGLDILESRFSRSLDYGENLIEACSKKELCSEVTRNLVSDTFMPEIERIYKGVTQKGITGHPVHYMIQTDDQGTRKGMYRALLKALYSNHRFQNKRYCFIDFKPGMDFSETAYDCLYKMCVGGAMVVRYMANDDSESDHATGNRETIETLCEVMKRYRNQVLTVFCLPRDCAKTKEIFYENLGTVSIVELKEEFVSIERAKGYLRMLARDSNIKTDRKLYSMLKEDETYLAPDLHEIFDEWYDDKLKTGIYPQYKEIATAKKEAVKTRNRGTAYDELSEMIGLTEAKKVIDQALNYFKAQRLFKDKGMKEDLPSMHMVFTGNPGTAKTTVARLFARIMKENDLLSKGKCVEVGRGDLVGKYVGWTAPTIQKKFREAQGSVLFIDEAYSLVDDRDGSYGDEAISTIVQEMENHREDVIVIFAGYPDKMEAFLNKNPGLRSRIAFHVPFSNYDTEELCGIARLIAKKKGLTLTDEASEKLSGIFDTARKDSDFGNGRYVRNAIEKARMAQATRLLSMDYDLVGKKEISTILAGDIEIPAELEKPKKTIGFQM